MLKWCASSFLCFIRRLTANSMQGLLRACVSDNSWSLEDTLKFAGAMGASCVRELGCTAGLFTMPEARAFVDSNELELTVERSNRDD